MSDNDIKKLAVIGLDGATFDLILPWVEQGYLPHFRRLLAESAHGPLRSTIHPISPQAWSTFITGKNAGKHGIFDFLVKKPNTYQFALNQGGRRQSASLWQMLGQAGKQVAVINVPFTYPAEPVNGVMVSGFDAPRADSTFCHPPDVVRQITQAVGEYYLHEMYPVGRRKADYEGILRREVQNRVAVTRYLLGREAWDFYMVVINATDLVQHLYWAEMENPDSDFQPVIRHIYQAVDAALGEIWEMLGQDVTMFVMSDHGAGPIRKSIYLNEWLWRQGWLTFHQDSTALGQQAASRWIDQGRVALKRYLPRLAKDWLKHHLFDARNRVESWLQTSEIDWAQTLAFAGGNFGNIYLNVRGREPNGIVEPGPAYEKLLAEITTALFTLRDPDTGEPIVEQVHRREALYQGSFTDLAPDLVIQWRDYAYFSDPKMGGAATDIFAPPPPEDATEFEHSGTHRVNGIFLATGPGIQPGPIAQANIADIAPTILHAFGLGVPEDMDGQVLQSIFRNRRPVTIGPSFEREDGNLPLPTYSEDEAAEMAERLRSLGYIE